MTAATLPYSRGWTIGCGYRDRHPLARLAGLLVVLGAGCEAYPPCRDHDAIELTYRIPLVLGILCLSAPGWMPPALHRRFVPPARRRRWPASSCWPRAWDSRYGRGGISAATGAPSVVVKEDHALIRSGSLPQGAPSHLYRHAASPSWAPPSPWAMARAGRRSRWPSSPFCSRAGWRKRGWRRPSPSTRNTGGTPPR